MLSLILRALIFPSIPSIPTVPNIPIVTNVRTIPCVHLYAAFTVIVIIVFEFSYIGDFSLLLLYLNLATLVISPLYAPINDNHCDNYCIKLNFVMQLTSIGFITEITIA